MEFFNELGKKITNASNATVNYTKKITEVSKLKDLIAKENTAVSALYEDLGKKYFEAHIEDCEEFSDEIEKLKTHLSTIVDLKEQVKELNKGNVCPKCGAKIKKNAAFCSTCGAKIEPIEEDQEPKEAEKEVENPVVEEAIEEEEKQEETKELVEETESLEEEK